MLEKVYIHTILTYNDKKIEKIIICKVIIKLK